VILPGKKGVVWWVWLYYVVSCCIGGYIDYWKDDAMFFPLYIIISNYLIWYRWLVIISNYLKLDIPPKKFLMKQEHFPRNGYGSIPIDTIFNGMDIHLPAILMFTRGTRFWHIPMLIILWKSYENPGFFHWSPGQKNPAAKQLTAVRFTGLLAGMAVTRHSLPSGRHPAVEWRMNDSMDWFKGKSTGNHGFYHQI